MAMMNFDDIHKARKYVREMSAEDTIEIADYSVMEYGNGEIELVAVGEEHSDTSDAPLYLGKVSEVLY